MSEEQVEVSQSDVDNFTQKLNAWSETLDPAERALLGMIIGRASGEGSEVEGYAMPSFGDAAFSLLGPMAAGRKKGKEVIDIGTDDDGTWLKGGTA